MSIVEIVDKFDRLLKTEYNDGIKAHYEYNARNLLQSWRIKRKQKYLTFSPLNMKVTADRSGVHRRTAQKRFGRQRTCTIRWTAWAISVGWLCNRAIGHLANWGRFLPKLWKRVEFSNCVWDSASMNSILDNCLEEYKVSGKSYFASDGSGSFQNNFAYNLHKRGVGRDYEWEVNYSTYDTTRRFNSGFRTRCFIM